MDAFGWEVVGSVAAVLAVAVAILQFIQSRKGPSVAAHADSPGHVVEGSDGASADARARPADGVPVVAGDIPQEPAGFQPRSDLFAKLDARSREPVSVVYAVTGMRGVGKTQLAAAYARTRISEGWRLVAWVNAGAHATVLGGLAEVAAALKLDAGTGDAKASGQAVRHWLETDGDRCLLVFDNATDPQDLQPFLPAAGQARVLITSNEWSVADLGAGVAVDVFTWEEAEAFLADRTGSADADGARQLAAELGRLPLALAQAAAVIAAQHLDYPAYLRRLQEIPVDQLLLPVRAGLYPHGLAAAVLLSLDAAEAADRTGVCGAVMDLVSVMSAAGVPRALLHTAGRLGALTAQEQVSAISPYMVDEALGQLAGSSLLTFSVDGATVTAHLLVTRVVRERLDCLGRLSTACQAAAATLEARAESLREEWQDRPPEGPCRADHGCAAARGVLPWRGWRRPGSRHLAPPGIRSPVPGRAGRQRRLGHPGCRAPAR